MMIEGNFTYKIVERLQANVHKSESLNLFNRFEYVVLLVLVSPLVGHDWWLYHSLKVVKEESMYMKMKLVSACFISLACFLISLCRGAITVTLSMKHVSKAGETRYFEIKGGLHVIYTLTKDATPMKGRTHMMSFNGASTESKSVVLAGGIAIYERDVLESSIEDDAYAILSEIIDKAV